MATASARFFSLFPLLLHTRSSSLHLFRRLRLATRHSPLPIPSPLNALSPSPFLPPLRTTSHQSSSLHSQPLNCEEPPSPFPESLGTSESSGALQPWPEWLEFVNWVSSSGYCNGSVDAAELVEELEVPLEFLRTANGCLDFARNHPNLLCSLPRKDIEVVIDSGSPFLFKDAFGTTRRMKAFLGSGLNDVLESDKPSTVDLMRFLLSYAHMAFVSLENRPIHSRVESSVRKLLGELVNSRGVYADSNVSVQNRFSERYGQVPRSPGQNIEMKRGDWICPRCSFMNFAKNFKCRECEEPTPKKHLTGGEWECPQCNFCNFSKNAMCLRCDCKKPGQNPSQSPTPVLGLRSQNSSVEGSNEMRSDRTVEKMQQQLTKITELEKLSDIKGTVEDGSSPYTINMEISAYLGEVLDQKSATDVSNIDMDLSLNEQSSQLRNEETEQAEKSERWFKKVSELYDVDDLANAIPDEEFPGIMPMRKGENRFVVSKKKDRSLTSPMYKRRMAMEQRSGDKYVPFVPFPPDYFAKDKPEEGSDSRVPLPDNSDNTSAANQQFGALSSNLRAKERSANPKSSDLGSSSPETNLQGSSENDSAWRGKSLEGSAVKEPDPLDMSEEAKAERWFRRVAQIKDISELSQIPDEDFPSIMPMRKGVNRFVVSKRKTPLERRLTSSQYRRNLPVVSSEPVKKEPDSN